VAIRVVVAEDSLIMREGLRQLLATSPRLDVVAAHGDLDAVLDAMSGDRPDVILTDIRMPPSNTDEGIRLADHLREHHPATGVIVLSQYAEPPYVLALLEHGSDRRGYLLKERIHERGQLVSAIDTVARGGSVIDPRIVELLVEGKARADQSPLAELSPRERHVLAEMAEGKSNAAIAESLVLTKRAVEKHINSIFMKLGLAGSEDDVEEGQGDPDVPFGLLTLTRDPALRRFFDERRDGAMRQSASSSSMTAMASTSIRKSGWDSASTPTSVSAGL
jgi:DNA-binding NarL/FixJ family response regulator